MCLQVERPSFSMDGLRRHTADPQRAGGPAQELEAQKEPMLTCELCGKVDLAQVFKRSKRFCSTVCAKRYNVGCTKRMGLFPNRRTPLDHMRNQRTLKDGGLEGHKETSTSLSTGLSPALGESSQCSDLSGYDRPPSPLGASPLSFLSSEPGQWNIEEVYEFISSLPGCLDFAEQFRGQEIDGQALLLLEEDHLMGTMNIKLGPALKICAQISSLRDS